MRGIRLYGLMLAGLAMCCLLVIGMSEGIGVGSVLASTPFSFFRYIRLTKVIVNDFKEWIGKH